jgi:N-methylhydantoinase A/oxoprolinase/acetone carboxylase beta subunit
VLDGDLLAPGAVVAGPALIEERFTVVAVPPGWTATLGAHAAYELTR